MENPSRAARSISEVRVRDQEVRFALKTRHCQPGLSGLKSANNGSRDHQDKIMLRIYLRPNAPIRATWHANEFWLFSS